MPTATEKMRTEAQIHADGHATAGRMRNPALSSTKGRLHPTNTRVSPDQRTVARWVAALHEAGHAVAMDLLGYENVCAEITSDADDEYDYANGKARGHAPSPATSSPTRPTPTSEHANDGPTSSSKAASNRRRRPRRRQGHQHRRLGSDDTYEGDAEWDIRGRGEIDGDTYARYVMCEAASDACQLLARNWTA
jgi:hypothetical protein